MSSSVVPDIARYDKYRDLNKNDRTPRLSAQEGFDRRFPFVSSSRPSQERQASTSQIPPANASSQNRPPDQRSNGVPPPLESRGSHMQVPQMPRQSAQGGQLSQKLLHPMRSSTPASQGQLYDDNFNPIQAGPPAGSRAPSLAPSVASTSSSLPGRNDNKRDKERDKDKKEKKKNVLKKLF